MRPSVAHRHHGLPERIRAEWLGISAWREGIHGRTKSLSFGRCPLRASIGATAGAAEGATTTSIDGCRLALRDLVSQWPRPSARMAVAGDTGLGKTTLALELCLRHARGDLGIEGALLYVVHDRQRVREILERQRMTARASGLAAEYFVDLLGRQAVYEESGEDWSTVRFGCKDPVRAGRAGRRGRLVQREVCARCADRAACQSEGFLAHTREALHARVVVTTVAKLSHVPDSLWKKIGAVICDEDVLSGLAREFHVVRADLARAARWIRRQVRRRPESPRLAALRRVLPLIDGILGVLASSAKPGTRPLVLELPESCERFATDEGRSDLLAALPRSRGRTRDAARTWTPDARAPAEWERPHEGSTPRQCWGALIAALAIDLHAGDGIHTGTVEVVGAGAGRRRARLRVRRFDTRTVRRLRERPLLLLDATLHPAVAPVFDVEVHELRFDQGRTIVQALGPLGRLPDLCGGPGPRSGLTPTGRRLLAQVAAFADGRRAYVLCRTALAFPLRREAQEYSELRRTSFVTVRRERGWDAAPDARVFVVLGRYAKNGDACVREARALRSLLIELKGSTAALDRISAPDAVAPFRGRGAPVTFCGEPVERVGHRLEDPLAAALQEADRVATVRQFIGRDRSGSAEVLLLRGDPTVGVDGLYDARDLPEAIPARDRRLVGGRTVP